MTALSNIGILGFVAACSSGMAVQSAAQDYPAKPVRILTGYSATMMDIVGRQLALRLGERWGQPAVMDNRGLGIAPAVTASAAPDGYTLMVADSNMLAIRPTLYRSLPYDPKRDFAPIALIASSPSFLVAHPSVPAANLGEFIAYVKRQPGGMDFATAGPWTPGHLSVELLRQLTGINVVPVNYKGGGAAIAGIISGEAKAGFSLPFMSLPHVKAGRVKAYAVTSSKRFAGTPEIPTMAETGVGNLVTKYWFGFAAPVRTPPALVNRINREVVELLQTPAMKSALLEQGAEPGVGTPGEFGAFIRSETARFKKVIEAAGIRAE